MNRAVSDCFLWLCLHCFLFSRGHDAADYPVDMRHLTPLWQRQTLLNRRHEKAHCSGKKPLPVTYLCMSCWTMLKNTPGTLDNKRLVLQVAFFQLIALPMYITFQLAFPACRPMVDTLMANYNDWVAQEAEAKQQQASPQKDP